MNNNIKKFFFLIYYFLFFEKRKKTYQIYKQLKPTKNIYRYDNNRCSSSTCSRG